MFRKIRTIIPMLCLFCLFGQGLAATQAQTMNQALGHGINLGNYFDSPEYEGSWNGDNTIQQSDLANIAAAGYKSVRIPVRWSEHPINSSAPYTIDAVFMTRVRQVVDWAIAANLKVVLNIHHYTKTYTDFKTNPTPHVARIDSIWSQIADNFDDISTSDIVFEMLNEPEITSDATWNSMVADWINFMRNTKGVTHTLMVDAGEWTGIGKLSTLAIPSNETNTIASFHYYDPFSFTHQQLDWTTPANTPAESWTATASQIAAVKSAMDIAAAYSKSKGVPVNIGEFGAAQTATDNDRALWAYTVTSMAAERGMSTHYWEYSSGFGVFNLGTQSWNTQVMKGTLGATTTYASPVLIWGYKSVYQAQSVPLTSARLPDGSTESYFFTTNDAGTWDDNTDSYGTSFVSPAPGVYQDMMDSITKHQALYYGATLTDAITYPYTSITLKWKPNTTVNGITTEVPYDLSSYSGLCVTYTSEKPVPLKLRPANYHGDYNLYQVTLPATTGITSQYFPFSTFAQEKWGVSVANNLTNQGELQFQYQNAAGTSNVLKIYQIGLGDACNSNDNYFAADAFEPANDAKITAPTLATTGPSNVISDLTLPAATDVDYFTFTLDHMSRTKISLPVFSGTDITMQILDISGNEIASTTTTMGTYLMENMDAGTYFVKLSTLGYVENYSLSVTETPEAVPEILYRNGDAQLTSTVHSISSNFYAYQDKLGYSKWYSDAPAYSNTIDILQKAGEYAGIGTDWNFEVDFSAYTGLCVTYKADQNVRVALFAKNDDKTGYNHYERTLDETSGQFVSIHLPWSEFAQGNPNGTLVSKAYALENVMGIRFMNSQTAVAQRLQVAQIGLGNTCDNSNNPSSNLSEDAKEPNNSIAEATAIDLQNPLTDLSLHESNDVDYFKITLPQAVMLTADISEIIGYGATLQLLNQAGNVIRTTTTQTSSAQIQKLLSAGTYYLQVTGNYEVQNYSLATTLGNAPADQIVWSMNKNQGTQIDYNGTIGGSWYSYTDGKYGSVSGIPFTITPSNAMKWKSILTGARLGESPTALGLGALGFNWTSNNAAADLSAHNGICLTYRSGQTIRMQMNQKDAGTFDQYSYALPATSKWKKTYIPFSILAQVGWDNHPFTFDPSNQESVQFIYEKQAANSSTVIEIAQVGLGDVCEETTVPTGLTIANTLLWDATTPDATPDQLDIGNGIDGGYWFDYSDAQNGGSSVVTRTNDSYGVATANLALGGRFGKDNQAPYAAIGAGFTGSEYAVDFSSEYGICVTYRATRPVLATLQQNNLASYDDFVVEIPAQAEFNARYISFNEFHQRGFGFSQPLDPTVLTQIHFRDTTTGSNTIEIAQIGHGNHCADVRFAPKALATNPTSLQLDEEFAEQRIDLSSWFEDRDGAITLSVLKSVNGILNARIEGQELVLTSIPNKYGTVKLTITATDADGQTATIDTDLEVINVLDLPVLTEDKYKTNEDVVLTIPASSGLLSNDNQGDEASLVVSSYTQTTNGTVEVNPDGSFTYTPNLNFNGTDEFTYKANGKATSTVTIEVQAVNDVPQLVGTLASPSQQAEDFDSITVDLNGIFSDPENDAMVLAAKVTTGGVTVSIDQATGIATIQSVTDYYGQAAISFTASDAKGPSVPATIAFDIIQEVDIPAAQNFAASMNEDAVITLNFVAGVFNPDNQAYNITVQSGSNYTLEFVSSTEYKVKPVQDFNGKLTVHFSVTADNGTKVTEADASITVNPINDSPTAIGGILTPPVDEDFAQFTIAAHSVFIDPDGDALSYSVAASSELVKANIDATGLLTLESVTNKYGTVTITISASDKKAGSTAATVKLDLVVNPINDAPVAYDALYKGREDARFNVALFKNGLLSDAEDIDGDNLTAVLVNAPAHGTLTLNPDGTFEYIPNPNWFGTDAFTFQASDGKLTSETKTVTLEVASENDLPVAVADVYQATEDTKLIIDAEHGMLINDSDLESTELLATLVSVPTHGKVIIQSNGSFEYTPSENFNGTDVFYYKAYDGTQGFSNVVSVTINVSAVNDAPVAIAHSYNVAEDAFLSVTAAKGVLQGATDVDGDMVKPVVGTGPSHGELSLAIDGSFDYRPEANFNGTETFTIIPTDGIGQGSPVTVTIVVAPVNDKPIAVTQPEDLTVEEDFATKTISLLGIFSDVDGDVLRYAAQTSNGKLSASITSSNLTLQSVKDSNGVSTIKVYAYDIGPAPADSVVFKVTITALSDAPTAVANAYTVKEDAILTVAVDNSVLKNDVDGDADAMTAVLADKPIHGTLTFAADGSFTYKPNANYNGTDNFTYLPKDATLEGNEVTVSITVESVNDKPEAIAEPEDIKLKTNFEKFTVNLNEFFSDKDGDLLTYSISSTSVIKTTVDGSNLVVESLKNKFGTQTVTITAKDPSETRSTVTLTVIVENTTPVLAGKVTPTDWRQAILNGQGNAVLTRIDGSRIGTVNLPASPDQILRMVESAPGITMLKIQGRTWTLRK